MTNTCAFCKDHIEFPSHAIGRKIPCPHCGMDVILKEPS
jgi:DNA-directed RNA polymerase subunit RPC12/RpoP